MLQWALVGAGVSLVAGLLAYIIITGLALLGMEKGGTLPTGIVSRLSLAGAGIVLIVQRVGATLSRYVGVALAILGLLAIGAAAGIVAYLARLRTFSNNSRHSSRRVRRKRRSK